MCNYEDKEETSKQECQANVIYMEDDKNCQSTLSRYQVLFTWWPVKLEMKKSSHMWLAKPEILQSD